MRRAMAEAELGDDVFGDDPTVIALEERSAELLGKEAGLFVPSGTMGNLVSQMAQVQRGGEIVTEAESHIVWDEAAGHAVVVGASTRGVHARDDGTLDLDDLRDAFRDPSDPHEPLTALLCLENTHAHSMGQPLTADYTRQVAEVAHAGGVPLHLDGARLFNAAVALRTPARELAAPADSVSFCLSKGLACPVGSVVVGSRDFIWRARRARKLLGGGMRQAGVLAAPGLIALRDGPSGMIDRLADDHANARRLAEGLVQMPGIGDLDPTRVRTNFVFFRVRPSDPSSPAAGLKPLDLRARFLEELAAQGVVMVAYPHGQVRAVTHYGVEPEDIELVLAAVRRTLATIGAGPSQVQPAAALPSVGA
jgi:threonine aldolase